MSDTSHRRKLGQRGRLGKKSQDQLDTWAKEASQYLKDHPLPNFDGTSRTIGQTETSGSTLKKDRK